MCPNSLWERPWDEDTRSSQSLQETQRSEMKRRLKAKQTQSLPFLFCFFFFSEHRGRKAACPEDITMHQKYPTCIHLAREHVQVRMFLRLEVGGSYAARSLLWLSSAASCSGLMYSRQASVNGRIAKPPTGQNRIARIWIWKLWKCYLKMVLKTFFFLPLCSASTGSFSFDFRSQFLSWR